LSRNARARFLLLAVYASTRIEELSALGWDQIQKDAFIRMQYMAQSRSYPVGNNQIIVLDQEPIGRILTDTKGDVISLVDIALLPQHRNRGIGTALIKDLLARAEVEGKSVTLHVFRSNPASRLYERLGFVKTGGDAAYLEMTWEKS
jgi:ribosomal protein S18 acetylase RimI-like enzyme